MHFDFLKVKKVSYPNTILRYMLNIVFMNDKNQIQRKLNYKTHLQHQYPLHQNIFIFN